MKWQNKGYASKTLLKKCYWKFAIFPLQKPRDVNQGFWLDYRWKTDDLNDDSDDPDLPDQEVRKVII